MTPGPDGALWFTNSATNSHSVGRITTGGVVSTYSGSGIDGPRGITLGPDGALWFTNFDNSSIGRITPDGTVSNYAGAGIMILSPHRRPRRGPVVHQLRQRLRQVDHHRWGCR